MDKDKLTCALLTLSMAVICDISIAGIGIYTVVLMLLAVCMLMIHILNTPGEIAAAVRRREPTVLLAAAIVVWELIRLVYIVLDNISGVDRTFEPQIQLMAAAIIYMVYRTSGVEPIKPLYINILIGAGCVGMIIAAVYMVTDISVITDIFPIIKDGRAWSGYVLVIAMYAGDMLYRTRNSRLRRIYAAIIGLCYIELVLYGDAYCILLTVIYCIAVPAACMPTKALVSQYTKQLFALLFIASNMSLLTGYTEVIKHGTKLSLEAGIYIDIVIAIAGLVFTTYWERMPEEADEYRLVLKRMRKGYRAALYVAVAVVLVLVSGGKLWKPAEDSDMQGFLSLTGQIVGSLTGRRSIVTGLALSGDVVGAVLLLLLTALVTYRGVRRISIYRPRTSVLALMGCVYAVLVMTTGLNAGTAIVYGVTMVMAAYGHEDREKLRLHGYIMQQDRPAGTSVYLQTGLSNIVLQEERDGTCITQEQA